MAPKAKASTKTASAVSSYQTRPPTQRPIVPVQSGSLPTSESFKVGAPVKQVGALFTAEVVNSVDFLPSESFVDSSCSGLSLWPFATRWRRLSSEETCEQYPPSVQAAAPAKTKTAPPGKAAVEVPLIERLAEFQKTKTMFSGKNSVLPADAKNPAFLQWFYSALAAIQMHAEFLFKQTSLSSLVFPQTADGLPLYNPRGKYVVRLCIRGQWTAVIVDDFVPESLGVHTQELWTAVILKALLKAYAPVGNSDGSWIFHIPIVAALTGWTRQDVRLKDFDAKKFPIATVSLGTEMAPVVAPVAVAGSSESEISDDEEQSEQVVKKEIILSPRISGHDLIFAVVQVDRPEETGGQAVAQVRGLIDPRLQPVGGEKTRDESADIHGASEQVQGEAETSGTSEKVRLFRAAFVQQSADTDGSFWLSEIDEISVRVWTPYEKDSQPPFLIDASELPMYVQIETDLIAHFHSSVSDDRKFVRLERLREKSLPLTAAFEPHCDLGRSPQAIQQGTYRVSSISNTQGVLQLAGKVGRIPDEGTLADSHRTFQTVVSVRSEISCVPGYAVLVKKAFVGESDCFRLFGDLHGLEKEHALCVSLYKQITDFSSEEIFSNVPLALAADYPSLSGASLVLIIHGEVPALAKVPISLHFVGLKEPTSEPFPTQVTPSLVFYADTCAADTRHSRVLRERLTVATDVASACLRVRVVGKDNLQVKVYEQRPPNENAADPTDPAQYKRLKTLKESLVELVSVSGNPVLFPHIKLQAGVVYILEAVSEGAGAVPWTAEIFGAGSAVELGADKMQSDIEKLLVGTWPNGQFPKSSGEISDLWTKYYAAKELETSSKVAAIRAKKPTGKNKDIELAAQEKEIASLVYKAPTKTGIPEMRLVQFPNLTVRSFVAELLGVNLGLSDNGEAEPAPDHARDPPSIDRPLGFPVKVFDSLERPEDAATRAELHARGKRRAELLEIIRVKLLAQGPGNIDGFVLEEAVKLVEEAKVLEVYRIDKLRLLELVAVRIAIVENVSALTQQVANVPVDDVSDDQMNGWVSLLGDIQTDVKILKEKNVPLGEDTQNKLTSLTTLMDK